MLLLFSRFPIHGQLGLLLVLIFWILNWSLSGLLQGSPNPTLTSHAGFFPLWLGYSLTVDALVFCRKGHSMLSRNYKAYIQLFLVSCPVWWLFELINWRTGNWLYQGRDSFSNLQYFLFASISFSTVIPAVFGTAELSSTFNWIKRAKSGFKIASCQTLSIPMFIIGWCMLGLMLWKPRYCFPFVWISVHFIIEPLNIWLGNGTLLRRLEKGDWRTIYALATGCLICGFFWEMWNFYSYPKWVYQIPFVGFFKVFEMPILGYGGYIPFSFELFAIYHLFAGFLKQKDNERFIQL
ncbi:TPA: hypothetical protein EYN98_28920 [Candidatus Poribacteria bacterium]|nr:hypothetical protein [Candidatus Poribacteria bacterium]HIA69993.1 hypothetical protein [Candidatus Poribacteria bacterium]HIB92104.1 hypothetical protein [Candidatus Poribacteria bacterium]HIC01545.1 hypothetical protein [Candidatus Poribacteria bacterium]HIM11543.1 hypothetical protein [Candidatus Poribacteria bacterium]